MAFGRSNSLSLNTGATNTAFASQQNSQPPAGGSLFGGSLFGNNTTKPAAGNSLFGASTAQPAPASNSLFGASTTQPTQPGSLFGAAPAAQPAATNSLFGNPTNNNTNPSTSLFGQQAQAPTAGKSLFGATQPAGSSFFSSSQPASSSLFGAAQPAGSSLFGAVQTGSNQFGASNTVQPQAANMAGPQNRSLLGMSQYGIGRPAPFTGRLSMGQGNTTQTTSTPAAKLNWDNVRPTTRFTDLVDTAQNTLEEIDNMIRQQETFCKQIEAFLPVHTTNLSSLQPDIELIRDKCETAEQALITDAQGVQQTKTLTQQDHKDISRCENICENLRLPAQYHYAPAARQAIVSSGKDTLEDDFDVDLVGNYFVPMAADMQKLLDSYTSNLSEIENHLHTIEGTAVAQSQALLQQRNGGAGHDSVRQLADTLRGFESTILSTAARVGAARDGVVGLSISRNGHRA